MSDSPIGPVELVRECDLEHDRGAGVEVSIAWLPLLIAAALAAVAVAIWPDR